MWFRKVLLASLAAIVTMAIVAPAPAHSQDWPNRPVKIIVQFGVDPLGNSPEQFAKLIQDEIPVWIEAVEIAGVKTQ